MEWQFFLAGVVFVGFIFWYFIRWYFSRTKCKQCKKRGYIRCKGSQELDRWRGTKKVSETTASGKTKTRHVQCTWVERRYYYICNNCGNEYTTRVEEER